MAEIGMPTDRTAPRRAGWLTRLAASPRFQAWAARFPLTRGRVRREGQAMFDLVAGFCHSQVLMAMVRLGTVDRLAEGPQKLDQLAMLAKVPPDRMLILMRAAAALGLTVERRGHWRLTIRGAALQGVPGLKDMIAHHDILYRDLSDPVAFFRGEVETELAGFWPYVFGAGAANDPDIAARYSRLMADSQALVAEDTLAVVPRGKTECLLDIGGGTGAFLRAVGTAWPGVDRVLFDLPDVAPQIDGVRIAQGSFRDDPLPDGADAISLIRVLYDHSDDTVRGLLAKVHAALPPGGRVIVSEPMTGSATAPERAGDAYFALYCLAMRTGRARSAAEIARLLDDAGFEGIETPRSRRPYVTSVVTAVKKS